jgi:hypothetical protein
MGANDALHPVPFGAAAVGPPMGGGQRLAASSGEGGGLSGGRQHQPQRPPLLVSGPVPAHCLPAPGGSPLVGLPGPSFGLSRKPNDGSGAQAMAQRGCSTPPRCLRSASHLGVRPIWISLDIVGYERI